MSEFVEECRREWKRLRVPDPVANEMAADLAADLTEAESEGVSVEEVLGSGAFDPRSFAASWAAERGVIPQAPPMSRDRIPRRSRMRAAIAAFALIAIIGAVLAIVASPSGRVAIAPAFGPLRLRIAPSPLPEPNTRVFGVVSNGSGIDSRPIGLLLLVLGSVGIMLSMLYWSPWASPKHWSRRRKYSDGSPGDPGYY